MDKVYKKLKRQNGERFAQTLRNHHNGILEIPGIIGIVRHAGRNAEPLLPYLMSLMASNDDTPKDTTPSLDPFELLEQAGYDAFYADTLEKQNSIEPYFGEKERLCTFNDKARYQKYHIIHAVKKSVGRIVRDDFNGIEERQDEYGTSVISIQILKTGGFISIKNRYNHSVRGCDNTFGSNPDNIIEGLSASLKKYFDVDFSARSTKEVPLPDEYTIIGSQIFKHHTELGNIYYGDQAWAQDGIIHRVDKSAGDALFGFFLFDNKTKTLKTIDPSLTDSFATCFNRTYGGHKGLAVQKGNLTLNGEVIIGAVNSRIRTLYLPGMTEIDNDFLHSANTVTECIMPDLVKMGNRCIKYAHILKKLETPKLTEMGLSCLHRVGSLKEFNAPHLMRMGSFCFQWAHDLKTFNTPDLIDAGYKSLENADAVKDFNVAAYKKKRYGGLKKRLKIFGYTF